MAGMEVNPASQLSTTLYRLIEWFLRRNGRCIFPFADGKIEFMKPPRRYLIDLSKPFGQKILASTDCEIGGRLIGNDWGIAEGQR